MKVAVLGAAGRTGRIIVEQALGRGHEVRALARRAGQLPAREGLELVEGDARDIEAVRAVSAGVQAVMSALGPTREADVCSSATRNVLAVMAEGAGPKRYVVISGAGIDAPGDNKDLVGKLVSRLVKLLSPSVVADKEHELALLLDSDIA